MVRLLIFDLDGTMIDTAENISRVLNKTLKEFGLQGPDAQGYYSFLGQGARSLVSEMYHSLGGRDERTKEEILRRYLDSYNHSEDEISQPYKGIDDLLVYLKEKGIAVGVCTNKPTNATHKVLSRFYTLSDFLFIITDAPPKPRKPSAAQLDEVLLNFPYQKKDMLFVGDTEVDFQTAENAGIPFCAVTWGFRTREELEKHPAALIADHPRDIIAYLEGRNL